ncbi:MAG: aldo/keto reductase [Verrucomicrobia bacterium]|nr:aldo/keto reductase [Verrucomicrobiota bacterium]
MSEKVQWGILATGAIAKAFARGLKQSQTGALAAVGSRSAEKAAAFAAEFGAGRAHGSYEALLADPAVQAVYISTPHPQHIEWAVKAAEAGKHVLVEKPMGLNQFEAQVMIEAAVANRVFMMEAYMYRCHPQTARLVELLRDKVIGEVRVITATFSFRAGFDAESRIWSNAAAGGGILDVGGYTTSIARLIAGAATGEPFADPISVTGCGQLHPQTGVDAWAVGTLKFKSGIVATLSTGVGVNQENEVRIFGTEGNIVVPNPYLANRDGAMPGRILVNRGGAEPQDIAIDSPVISFAHEADLCARAIAAGRQEVASPGMTWADTLGNLRTLDAWRAAIGLQYEAEKPERMGAETLARRPLRKRADAPMTYGRIPHLDKPVSRLIMGVDNQGSAPHAAAIFDDYFARGGNTFDTAFIYGAAHSKFFGHWVRARGVRDEIVVIAKGAHTPACNPEALSRELVTQLGWMGIDYADLYMMHRDNPDIPVGRFVDVLNEHVKAGRIRAFGGSNWSLDRVKKANAYAQRKGLQGFSMVSNNLSLAEMVNPVWPGCIHVHDAADRRWLKKTQLALLPWSSQARGFFVPSRAHPDKREDDSLVECWYSEENFKRQARAVEVAAKYGVEPINVALAWVLQQPFPTFPLIGPRQISETRSSMAGLAVTLTAKEMRYLNLEV